MILIIECRSSYNLIVSHLDINLQFGRSAMRMFLVNIFAATFTIFHAAAIPLESVALVEDGRIHGTPAPNNVTIIEKHRIVDRNIGKKFAFKFS